MLQFMKPNLPENKDLVEYRLFNQSEKWINFTAVVAGILVGMAVAVLSGEIGFGVVAGALSAPTIHGLLHLR